MDIRMVGAFPLGLGNPEGAQKARPAPPDTPSDVLAHTLKEVYQRFAAGNPFEPGDLVTPRVGYGNRGEGRPHIVLSCFEPENFETEGIGMPAFAFDMRVLGEMRGEITPWKAESYTYEPYTGPVAEVEG